MCIHFPSVGSLYGVSIGDHRCLQLSNYIWSFLYRKTYGILGDNPKAHICAFHDTVRFSWKALLFSKDHLQGIVTLCFFLLGLYLKYQWLFCGIVRDHNPRSNNNSQALQSCGLWPANNFPAKTFCNLPFWLIFPPKFHLWFTMCGWCHLARFSLIIYHC